MKRPAGDWLVLAGGILVTLSSAAHAFAGWPGLAGELDPLSPSPELRETVAIGWTYGSAAMLALGVLALLAFAELPRAGGALVIGALYVVFGAAALVYSKGNPHFVAFVAFVAIGALLAGGALLSRRARGAAAGRQNARVESSRAA